MIFDTDAFAPPNSQDGCEERPMQFIDVHIYDLPPVAEEPPAVESDPAAPDQSEQERGSLDGEQDEQEAANVVLPRPPHKRLVRLLYVGLGVLLVGAVLTMLVLRPLLFPAPEATITIVPSSRPIRISSTSTVITGATPKAGQIAGRQLAAITMSQQTTIATTGTVHQDAQAARGLVTFYNAATYSQVIPAGTILTGTDGTQIVTEQDATIPAVSYPTLGAMTVEARALTPGPAGDIRAGDIYGPCCRVNVSAVSSAFTGGQNAKSYPTVSVQDISTAATSVSKTLVQSAQAALQTQVRPGETLITPLACQQHTTPNHQPGTEAVQVTITVSETCTGTVYNAQQYQNQLIQMMDQQAAKQLGAGYHLGGAIQSTITATSQRQQSIQLHLTSAATYTYQMSQDEQQTLAQLVAGKSNAEATSLVLHQPGVQSVALAMTGTTQTLPTDPDNIHLIIVDAA